MGEAKRRGTFEERKAQAIARQESATAKLKAIMQSRKNPERPRQLNAVEAMQMMTMFHRQRPQLPLIGVKK